MTVIALLMRTWIEVSREAEIQPRVLADDISFISHGKGCINQIINAMEISRNFLKDMGAKGADNKCFTFAIEVEDRKELDSHIWKDRCSTTPCSNSFRDLGTHLN